jgi:hypothetical protein
MNILASDKITEIFCIADDFCKECSRDIKKLQIQPGDGKRHGNRPMWMSESEIITILLLFHFGTFRNFKHFYLFYQGAFTERISQTAVIQSFCGDWAQGF